MGGSRAKVWRAEVTWTGVRVLARLRKLGFWDQLGRERKERRLDWGFGDGVSRVTAAAAAVRR